MTVYLDIYTCRDEYDFYNALAAAVLKQTATRPEQWMENARDFITRLTPKLSFSPEANSDFSISLGITPRTHTPEEVLQLAETVAIKRNKRIVVCLDEFQQIGEMTNSISLQRQLRSVWQHQQHTSYCLFGSKRHVMSNFFQQRNMPFFQFGDIMTLQRIDTATWIEYITSHFEQRDRHISSELAHHICDITHNHSSYVQQLSWAVFTQLNPGQTVTQQHLQCAVNDMLDNLDNLFLQQIEPLSSYQLNMLRAIIHGTHTGFGVKNVRERFNLGSASNIARLRTALIDKELIDQEGKELHITDPMFVLWFKRRGF